MKLFTATAIIASTAVSTGAFAPTTNSRPSRTTKLQMVASMECESAECFIEEAMAISKQHGPASPEARVAWEIVDEVSHAADMAEEATKPGLDEECHFDETTLTADDLCMEYSEKLYELEKLIHHGYASDPEPKKLNVDDIPRLPLNDEKAARKQHHVITSPNLRAAIKSAKKVTEEHGIASSEARIAWEVVEELSSSASHAALAGDTTVTEKKNVALKELNRILEQQELHP